MIVRFDSGARARERAETRASVGATVKDVMAVSGLQLLELDGSATVPEALKRLEADPDVRYAEPNVLRHASATVNDPFFPYLYALENLGQSIRGQAGTPGADIAAVSAWDSSTGAHGAPVAVVDSGVSGTHLDLRNRAWRNPGEVPGNDADDDGNGFVDDARGWDFVAGDPVPDDENAHGTHVAGTIAATGDDGHGVVGVAPMTTIMALRVLNAAGSGTLADVLDAYTYAAREGARIVNASLGGGSFSRAERDTIAAADDVLFVVAAGNGGADGVGDDNDVAGEYPCAYDLPNVLCVAATDNRDALAAFSNFGKRTVDLGAPGVDILSTYPPDEAGAPQWAFFDGTSMATPHVAGAAALVLERAPETTPVRLRDILLSSVDPLPALIDRTVTGGRLDVGRAVALVQRSVTPAPTPPTPAPAPPPSPTPAPAPVSPSTSSTRTVPGAIPDRTPPLSALVVSPRQRASGLRRRGLHTIVSCNEACWVSVTARVSARAAQRARLRTSGRSLTLGSGRRRLAAAGRAALVARLSTTARRRLRSRRSVVATVTGVYVDGRGNRRSLSRRVTIRPA